ncbi:MAG: PHP domain-containing protein [Woeseiaceae bacterium]|nr:PHP domain-containing protein [Woeseiaceae bacterium]
MRRISNDAGTVVAATLTTMIETGSVASAGLLLSVEPMMPPSVTSDDGARRRNQLANEQDGQVAQGHGDRQSPGGGAPTKKGGYSHTSGGTWLAGDRLAAFHDRVLKSASTPARANTDMTTDLHTHTTASDGALAPAALLARARGQGVRQLAITDHDTVAAFDAFDDIDVPAGLSVVTGIELSTYWRKTGVHVVGLNIDPASDALRRGIARQQAARHERALRIAARLVKKGLPDPLPAVTRLAGDAPVARPHFARHLVDAGHVKTNARPFASTWAPARPAMCGICGRHSTRSSAGYGPPAASRCLRTRRTIA